MLVTLTAVCVLTTGGCGPESRDFKREAERLINSDNKSQLPIDYTDATCEAPTSAQPGATFNCSAKGEDGASYGFQTKITGTRKFVVTLDASS